MGKGGNEPVENSLGQNVHDDEGPKSKRWGSKEPSNRITLEQVPGPGECARLNDHKLALEKQKERRERPPLFYCRVVTKWPLQAFCKCATYLCPKFMPNFNILLRWP